MSKLPVALQMYTVRDRTAEDFAGTYRAVAAMGYDGVEIAGDGGLSAAEMKQLLDDCGFARCGIHTMLSALEEDVQKHIDYNLEIGNKYLVVPWMPEELRRDAAGWRAVGARMAAIGAKLKAAGLVLGYHNHAFEFEVKEGDQFGFDILYASAPADLLQCEIDTYWVKFGGQDPAAYVARYKDRAPLLHLKDMTPGPEPTFTEVGTGTLDFASIIKAAEGGVTAALIVEQDRCERPSLESAKISHDNLRRIIAELG